MKEKQPILPFSWMYKEIWKIQYFKTDSHTGGLMFESCANSHEFECICDKVIFHFFFFLFSSLKTKDSNFSRKVIHYRDLVWLALFTSKLFLTTITIVQKDTHHNIPIQVYVTYFTQASLSMMLIFGGTINTALSTTITTVWQMHTGPRKCASTIKHTSDMCNSHASHAGHKARTRINQLVCLQYKSLTTT